MTYDKSKLIEEEVNKIFEGKITFCKNCGHTNRWHDSKKCYGTAENSKCDCPVFIEKGKSNDQEKCY